jgi:hypothetical protein
VPSSNPALTVRKAVAWKTAAPPALFLSSCLKTDGILANAFIASRHEGQAEQLSLHTCCTLQPDAAWQLPVLVTAEHGCSPLLSLHVNVLMSNLQAQQ